MKKTIIVDDISSIKHNHFTLLSNKRIIKDHPFIIKKAPDGSSYHFDKEDLEKMSKYEKDLAPHEETDPLSKREYILKMKKEFYHLIRSGEMDTILSRLYELEDRTVQLKWAGPIEYKFKV
ncbi:hypothetical protein [Planococcus shixiaomingii]|uniref:hypothetical protein n=1 Tax=Planococcus shixiaomingii TaxID=3058393 RepID=UPI002621E852|nr:MULTISPECIES: hypothetical protein [unclassified Planococcus (in: firmicutes)]WKA55562.1 hypothetical protein QWY21_04025 [Planococcus sp. N022]